MVVDRTRRSSHRETVPASVTKLAEGRQSQKCQCRGEPSLRDYIFFPPPPTCGRSADLSSPRPRKSPLGFDIRRVAPAKNWPSEFRVSSSGFRVVYRRRGWQKRRSRATRVRTCEFSPFYREKSEQTGSCSAVYRRRTFHDSYKHII